MVAPERAFLLTTDLVPLLSYNCILIDLYSIYIRYAVGYGAFIHASHITAQTHRTYEYLSKEKDIKDSHYCVILIKLPTKVKI